MKITSIGNHLAICTLLLFSIFIFAEWRRAVLNPPLRSIIVTIPPAPDADSRSKRLFNQFREPLFPYEDLLVGRRSETAALLEPVLVSIGKDGVVYLNEEVAGSLEDPEPLRIAILRVFTLRRYFGIVGQNGGKPFRGATVKAPLSARYGEVCTVVDVLKECGADPIILQIDDLPRYETKSLYGR